MKALMRLRERSVKLDTLHNRCKTNGKNEHLWETLNSEF